MKNARRLLAALLLLVLLPTVSLAWAIPTELKLLPIRTYAATLAKSGIECDPELTEQYDEWYVVQRAVWVGATDGENEGEPYRYQAMVMLAELPETIQVDDLFVRFLQTFDPSMTDAAATETLDWLYNNTVDGEYIAKSTMEMDRFSVIYEASLTEGVLYLSVMLK